ncbi:hypothetical protein LJC36_04165 [Desulfovibrio sp. OttesenSCG-928-C14]|nr:hypothetical protein [Desulfovibrio sp. OttesenSCG-928-C14]
MVSDAPEPPLLLAASFTDRMGLNEKCNAEMNEALHDMRLADVAVSAGTSLDLGTAASQGWDAADSDKKKFLE